MKSLHFAIQTKVNDPCENAFDGKRLTILIFYQIFSLGTDRSSIFVTLCILVQQLRLEKKVDVCTVVRKLRSQRSQFLSTYVSCGHSSSTLEMWIIFVLRMSHFFKLLF